MDSLARRVRRAGNKLCIWYDECAKKSGHWDNVGYKQGLRDALEIMKQAHAIKDYSLIDGVTLLDEDAQEVNER